MRKLTLLLVLSMLTSINTANALGPLDGEATIDWWGTELSGSPFDGDLDAGTVSIRGETWWDKKWGVRGGLNLTDINAPQFDDPKRLTVDLKRRLLSPTDNTFLAAGIGLEKLSLESGESSNGIRLSLEGRIGLAGLATLYGESVWMPKFGSVNDLDDISGVEFETGVVFDPLPFISIRAGYRRFKLDYNFSGDSGSTTTQGLLIGTGIHW